MCLYFNILQNRSISIGIAKKSGQKVKQLYKFYNSERQTHPLLSFQVPNGAFFYYTKSQYRRKWIVSFVPYFCFYIRKPIRILKI